MPGPKKRPATSAKQSAISKRHKAKPKPKKKYSGPKAGDDGDDAGGAGGGGDEPPASKRKSAFPADKVRAESAKKDRKGKGPAFIETVRNESGSESEGEDGGMEVDEDLVELGGQANFLTKLDEKGMAA